MDSPRTTALRLLTLSLLARERHMVALAQLVHQHGLVAVRRKMHPHLVSTLSLLQHPRREGIPDEDPYTPAPYTPYGAAAPTPGAGGGGYDSAPTPAFAKGSNKDPLRYNRLLDAPTPAAGVPTPYGSGFDAPTPAAGGEGPRYVESDEE